MIAKKTRRFRDDSDIAGHMIEPEANELAVEEAAELKSIQDVRRRILGSNLIRVHNPSDLDGPTQPN